MTKRRVITIIMVAIICALGVLGVVHHNNQVQAQQVAEAKIKLEKDNLKAAETAVELAYKTRGEKDIQSANQLIEKLNNNQKDDKTKLVDKMTKLAGYLAQIADVNTALEKATETKADTDVEAVQTLIDKVIDDYLKEDKEVAQTKLDSLKEQIAKAKADAEAKKKAEEEKAAAEAQAAADVAEAQRQAEAAESTQVPDQQVYNEQPQQSYNEPAQNTQQAAQAPQTPTQPQQDAGNTAQDSYQDSWNKTAEMYRQAEEWRNSPEAQAEAEKNGPGGIDSLGKMGEWQP